MLAHYTIPAAFVKGAKAIFYKPLACKSKCNTEVAFTFANTSIAFTHTNLSDVSPSILPMSRTEQVLCQKLNSVNGVNVVRLRFCVCNINTALEVCGVLETSNFYSPRRTSNLPFTLRVYFACGYLPFTNKTSKAPQHLRGCAAAMCATSMCNYSLCLRFFVTMIARPDTLSRIRDAYKIICELSPVCKFVFPAAGVSPLPEGVTA